MHHDLGGEGAKSESESLAVMVGPGLLDLGSAKKSGSGSGARDILYVCM